MLVYICIILLRNAPVNIILIDRMCSSPSLQRCGEQDANVQPKRHRDYLRGASAMAALCACVNDERCRVPLYYLLIFGHVLASFCCVP